MASVPDSLPLTDPEDPYSFDREIVGTLRVEGCPITEEGMRLLKAEIGRHVRDARDRLGMTQAELAEVFGKSKPWVSKIERGENFAPIPLLVCLSNSLGMQLGDFCGIMAAIAGPQEVTEDQRWEAMESQLRQLQNMVEALTRRDPEGNSEVTG